MPVKIKKMLIDELPPFIKNGIWDIIRENATELENYNVGELIDFVHRKMPDKNIRLDKQTLEKILINAYIVLSGTMEE